MKAGHTAQISIGISFAVFFIWLIVSQVEVNKLTNAFNETNTRWIAAALCAFCTGYACRIARWHKMLAQDNPELSWASCAGPLLASFAVNNVLPFRAGDIMRAFAFNNRLGTSSGIVLASLFVERLLDLLMVLLIMGSVLSLFSLNFEDFAGVGSILLMSFALLIILLLVFPGLFTPLTRVICLLMIRLLPRFGHKLATETNKGMNTLIHLAKKGTMFKLIIWSCAVWLSEGAVFWCAAKALPGVENPLAGWLALPVGTLATLIPSTPGYIGTFDFFTMKAMTVLGNSQAVSTAYAFLVHALLWVPPTLSGGLFLLFFNLQKSRVTNTYDK